jgi:hypothetical protein
VIDTAGTVMRPMLHSSLAVPSMVANAGARASRRFVDFFAASRARQRTSTRPGNRPCVCCDSRSERLDISQLADTMLLDRSENSGS